MSPYNMMLWLRAQASVARIKGMEAENQQRIALGHSMAYDETAFMKEAEILEQLAREVSHNE